MKRPTALPDRTVPESPAPSWPGLSASELAAHIRDRAFQLYEERAGNGDEGDPLSDWVRAERDIKSRLD